MIPILTVACRFNGQHDDCAGSIYLGSIFEKPTGCQCECHEEQQGSR